MPQLSFHSPLGAITVTEEDGALVSLDWGWAPDIWETPLLCRARDQLDAYFDGGRRAFDLPLAPRGTPFQQKVWTRIRDIAYGCTETYGEMARAVKSAPRAVGGACARNPLPILIPCHRVVGSTGALTGYSGAEGIDTKRWLLDLEAAFLGRAA